MNQENRLLEAYGLVRINVGDKINIEGYEEMNPFTLTETGLRNKYREDSDSLLPLLLSGQYSFSKVCEATETINKHTFKLSDEYVPVTFIEEDFDDEAYSVYKRATRLKNFSFYIKEGEPDRYYLELFESGRVSDIEGGIVNLQNWLRSWIDELGDVSVSKYDIRRAYKEEGIEL